MEKKKYNDLKTMICIIIISLLGFILLHDICGSSLLGHSPYDSYELQAEAWLNGRNYLDKNYTHLELAIYEGHYYVSFPPFPSVIMLPFVLIFGRQVPNNLIIAVICIITVLLTYKILRRQGTSDLISAFFAMFYVFGSNMLAMSMNGGVWFLAQSINLLLCTAAVDFYLKNKLTAAYIALGLAVGCRPFSAVYIVALFIGTLIRDGKKTFRKFLSENVCPMLPLIAIAASYMLYNYARFCNPFEFGHNYLPEFTESEHGQFSIVYFWPNLKQLFFEPIRINSELQLSFTAFNSFMFYIANPIFLIAAYKSVKNIIHTKRISVTRLILLIAMMFNIALLCCHKTLGGWQFGARYICDLMPAAFLCIITSIQTETVAEMKSDSLPHLSEMHPPLTLDRAETVIAVFGIMFNAFGAVEQWLSLM